MGVRRTRAVFGAPILSKSASRALGGALLLSSTAFFVPLALASGASAQDRGPVTPISESDFLSEVGGSDWLFDSGVGSQSDYAQLQASPLRGVPTYESPANAPAPTDTGALITASAAPAPASVNVAPITTARRPLKDLAGTVSAAGSALATPPKDIAQVGASALDESIDGADSPALPAYMNPENGGAAPSASSLGGLPALPPLSGGSSSTSSAALGGLPGLPPVQPVSAAPLPPRLTGAVDASSSAAASGTFDPYAYTADQAASITSPATGSAAAPISANARTVGQANTPIGDLPPLPPLNDVRVGNGLLTGAADVGANARTLPTGSTGADGYVPGLEEAFETAGIADEDLVVQIGGGVTFRPDYIGSDDMEVAFSPIIDFEYRERFFASTERGIGINLLENQTFDLAVYGDWRRGRDNDGDLSTFEDRDGSVVLGADAGLSFGPIRLGVRADYGLSGDMKGLQADVEASLTQSVDVFMFQIYGGAKVGDSEYIENRFGYSTADRVANTIATPFTSSGGLVDVHAGLAAKYFLTPNFALEANVEGAQLLGDAADSYIVDQLGAETQYQGTLGASYKF